MKIKEIILEEEKKAVIRFLKSFNLVYEDDIDTTLALVDGNESIIATVSAAGNIIKCVAVDPDHQGQNHLNNLMSHLIKKLSGKGIFHIFAYTVPELVGIFRGLGFKEIVQTMNLTFLELHGDIRRTLEELKARYELDNNPKGCVVINANPLTKGHLHLIRTAAKNHDELLVFVVSEDRSFFPFEDRFEIIKQTLADDENITVLPTKDYLVSYATFPKYFMKNEKTIKAEHALIDVLTFKQHYMRIFNITARYVGSEPYSPMTDTYNQTMKQYLGDDLEIIPRKKIDDETVSASTIRKLLRKNGLAAAKKYLPEATIAYLESPKGQAIIERLKSHHGRH